MAGAGQYVVPVEVEVTGTFGADVADDGAAPPFGPATGMGVLALDQTNTLLRLPRIFPEAATRVAGVPSLEELAKLFGFDGAVWRRVSVNGAGQLVVVMAAPPTPGTTITSSTTAVGIGATVALPIPPAGTLGAIYSNIGGAGSIVLIRETGGPAGAGVMLFRGGNIIYTTAVDAMTVQEFATPGVATTITSQFMGP